MKMEINVEEPHIYYADRNQVVCLTGAEYPTDHLFENLMEIPRDKILAITMLRFALAKVDR